MKKVPTSRSWPRVSRVMLASGESAKALELATSATLLITSAYKLPDLMSKFPQYVTPPATRNLWGSAEQHVFASQAEAEKVNSLHMSPKKDWLGESMTVASSTGPTTHRTTCQTSSMSKRYNMQLAMLQNSVTKPDVLVAHLPSPRLTAPHQHRLPSPTCFQTNSSRDFTAKPQQAWAKTSVVLSASCVLQRSSHAVWQELAASNKGPSVR